MRNLNVFPGFDKTAILGGSATEEPLNRNYPG